METVQDFEDILDQFARHEVRYLIVGGLAFIFHAKPRYTKDINLDSLLAIKSAATIRGTRKMRAS